MVIARGDCTDGEDNQLWEKLSKKIEEIFTGKLGYESLEQKNIRCGSVIVDLALKFNSTVRESEVLSILRDAKENGRFEDLRVSAIRGTRNTGITPTITTTPTSSSDSKQSIVYFDFVLGGLVSSPKNYKKSKIFELVRQDSKRSFASMYC
ncbi:uncharacterized protein LOC110041529 [Orbicella faveolata]|uniref:uncharacterized protein LOC110041529 n=1 Tax=Orbicella faveolata TaxID=48498 RepID=UPI0009E38517|nr:uncharacterized protein LOC110041529 [Orbicella faveolata]